MAARKSSSGPNVRVEAANLHARFLRLDDSMKAGVRKVIADYTDRMHDAIKSAASVPVTQTTKRGKKQTQRSKRGQAPRKDTGRLVGSLKKKLSPKGYVGSVSTSALAQDAKGRRYPWMLESGTDQIDKRPLFKRQQRLLKKPFTRDLVAAARAALRENA